MPLLSVDRTCENVCANKHLHVCVCVFAHPRYTCSVWAMTKPIFLTESVSMSINVSPVLNVNTNTKKTVSPLPELGAASRSRHQRWWLVWRRRRRRWGRSFLQLELSPSGNADEQKNPISRNTRFKLSTDTISVYSCLSKIKIWDTSSHPSQIPSIMLKTINATD